MRAVAEAGCRLPRYLRFATTKACSTASPLDLLPRPVPERTQPVDRAAAVPRATLSVGTVFRRYIFRAGVGAALSTAQHLVMTAIEQCRTAALGGHVEQCDHFGHRRVWYNSCRNRHYPTCQ